MNTTIESTNMTANGKTAKAQVVREYGPFGEGGVHGVTFDGKLVWFARSNELVAFDPDTGEVKRRLDVLADAGTAFDGEFVYQIAGPDILVIRPSDGRVVRKIPAPDDGEGDCNSGMAYADGYLWVGQWRESKINKVDPKTGAVVKTLSSDRWVTGVSCVDGSLWHATHATETEPAELRRLSADGEVEERLALPDGIFVSGVESDGKGGFFCGGGSSGKLRLVRKAS
ncbi:MAG TPA: glutamine cyclotransferase [Polyangiaceae bacterium]